MGSYTLIDGEEVRLEVLGERVVADSSLWISRVNPPPVFLIFYSHFLPSHKKLERNQNIPILLAAIFLIFSSCNTHQSKGWAKPKSLIFKINFLGIYQIFNTNKILHHYNREKRANFKILDPIYTPFKPHKQLVLLIDHWMSCTL